MTEIRTSSVSGVELLVPLDRDDGAPLHRQVETAIRDAIRSQRLRHGTPVPSSRGLAADLGVSRGVIVEAYEQLVAEGYLTARAGGSTTVASIGTASIGTASIGTASIGTAPTGGAPSQLSSGTPVAVRQRPAFDMLYGRPDVTQFPRAAWLRSARRAINDTPSERFIYLDGRGAPELRIALSDYLNRVRGTWADPEKMLICNGFAQGFALATEVLWAAGVRRLAVEDPSFEDLRSAAAARGMDVVGIPVSEAGVDVDALERSGAQAALVTPAHQLTGAVLSPESRTRLVSWAEQADRLIIEDDYDAEFRYTQTPVGALHGLAPDRVLYIGSASKTLAPGLRLGWIIAPGGLVDALAAAKVAADRGSPVLDQLTFADFLVRGEYDRHLRRMRPIYRGRRDALLRALSRQLPGFRPSGVSAGLHLIAHLPAGVDEDAVVRAAAARGVAVNGLAPHRIAPGPPALIFGFAALNERAITQAVAALADACMASPVDVPDRS